MIDPRFTQEQIDKLKQFINIHLSLPMKYELAGSNFETLFALMIGGKRETRKLLFDVIKDTTGWSLKTLQTNGNKFEIVLKRCNVINKDLAWQTSDAQIIGDAIIDNVNEFYSKSVLKQDVADKRLCILLASKDAKTYRIFQQKLAVYEKDDIEWRFSKQDKNGNEKPEIKSLMGYHEDKLVYRWYRSGTQLFGVYDVPIDIQSFSLDVRDISFESLVGIFTTSPSQNEQLLRQQVALLNSQPDDTENDSSQ